VIRPGFWFTLSLTFGFALSVEAQPQQSRMVVPRDSVLPSAADQGKLVHKRFFENTRGLRKPQRHLSAALIVCSVSLALNRQVVQSWKCFHPERQVAARVTQLLSPNQSSAWASLL
jgi:hypothetical protein